MLNYGGEKGESCWIPADRWMGTPHKEGGITEAHKPELISSIWTVIVKTNISKGGSFHCNFNIHVKVGILFMNWGVGELWGWDVWQILAPPQKLPSLLTTLEEQANMTVAKHLINSISPDVTFKTSCMLSTQKLFWIYGFRIFSVWLITGWLGV